MLALASGLSIGWTAIVRSACGSELALPLVSGADRPSLILAQRVIDRSWGPAEDSVYVETEVPEWRSEGLALALSAVVPGAGQAYAGDWRRVWFALAEAAGWTARQIYRHRGAEIRDAATRYAGSPSDSASAWSFGRWENSTRGDASELVALYDGDREVFYDLIASDPRYLAGWSGNAAETRSAFSGLRRISDDRLRYARYTTVALWLNHVISAVDALRAARLHDVPLRPHLGLKLKSGWRGGGPVLSAAIERRF